MPDWTIVPLGKEHDRSGFDCGEPSLTDWLRTRATQYRDRGLARTYVAVRPGEVRVLGDYAIASHHVVYEALTADQARGLPRSTIPVILLGRLGTDVSVQGQGLGKLLVVDALRRALFLSERLGCHALEVDALNDRARKFYLDLGFTSLADDIRHLFYPLKLARKLGLTSLAD